METHKEREKNVITKEALEGWKGDPVTIEVFHEVTKMVNGLTNALASGQTLSGDPGETLLNTSKMIGNIEGLNQILNISHGGKEDE